ncbi:MAG: esterase family protein [Clostridia bacterium]|nr:esterase family protein [Clostridia bacterium]
MLSTLSFRANSLNYDTVINVVLPDTTPTEDIPVLWLLHGMHGNHESWIRKTNIERYAAARHIAVVCADGENGFYHDMKYGKKYFTFFTEELPGIVRRVYRISDKREKNIIAGLSMGGYGALRLALLRPDMYAAAASLSGCVDMCSVLAGGLNWSSDAAAIWGDDYATCAVGTDSDLFHVVRNYSDDVPKPGIFTCCGTEDFLYKNNLRFRDFMQSEGTDKGFTYKWDEGRGIHDWRFWDAWIGAGMDFCLDYAQNTKE